MEFILKICKLKNCLVEIYKYNGNKMEIDRGIRLTMQNNYWYTYYGQCRTKKNSKINK